MTFDTFHEAYEWISSDAFNKIGYDYEGYKTTDPKLAYELLFQLVRAKTLETDSREVYADVEFSKNSITYMVWVSRE
ncbi:hypothetical protein KP014_01865 [Paenibacillus sophorae]|nr:hypothetical protein KP014_01865 [Paenibacillus sophorae]